MYDVHTEITLKNGIDAGKAAEGLIKETDVRQAVVQAVVDTGAWTLVINEETRIKLGLKVRGTDKVTLADGATSPCTVAGPLEVVWKDRRTSCDAVVLPDANEILLGAIPLEALDITVNPRLGEVVGAHGDQPLHRLY
jgi:clan AA aspartic protease